MKALMSQRAKDVLADPRAKGQLRAFLAAKSSQAQAANDPPAVIELSTAGRTLRLLPRVVPGKSA